MRTGRALLTALCLLSSSFWQMKAQQMPYLSCTPELESSYGVNTSITRRNGGEFECRDEALKLISATSAEYVRIPLDWDNFCSADGILSTRMYDAALESLNVTPLFTVGMISSRYDRNRTAWTDPSAFAAYLKGLVLRYRTRISVWEVFNGSDEIYSKGEKISAARYHSVLKGISKIIKSANPGARILLGTPYGLKSSFLDSLSACGTPDYFDIMTFSAYSNPEEIPSLAMTIRRAMIRGGWSKPVWLTNASCGYKPSSDLPFSFWKKDVPVALKSAGLPIKNTMVTVVEGALNDYEIKNFLAPYFRSVKIISASELSLLDASTHKVLVPGRNVPQSEIKRYVDDGGIVIVGSPRWPDAIHVGVVAGPGRYLGGSNLRTGEKMEILDIRNGNVVSAFYRLSSGGAVVLSGKGPGRLFDWESEQAEKLARIHILAFASGVDKVFWNGIRSRENDMQRNSDFAGLCHADLSAKPAYTAYKTLLSMLPSGSTRPVLEADGNVYLASWIRSDGQKIYAVWSPEKTGINNLQLSGKYSVYNHMGGKIKALPNPGPGVTYIVGAEKVEFIK